jgi:hypothetical protein
MNEWERIACVLVGKLSAYTSMHDDDILEDRKFIDLVHDAYVEFKLNEDNYMKCDHD